MKALINIIIKIDTILLNYSFSVGLLKIRWSLKLRANIISKWIFLTENQNSIL